MAVRGFSVKQPLNKRDRRTALVGWGMGAFVALGAYVGALQFYPASPSMPMMAGLSTEVDPIQTGSIGSRGDSFNALSHNALPGMPLQAQIDSIKIELAAMREMMAAAQASSTSTNRRLQDIEQSISFVTASIGDGTDRPATADQQPLPQAIGSSPGLTIAQPNADVAPRIVLPAPMEVEGGAVSITMRPMDVSGILGRDPEQVPPMEDVSVDSTSDDDLTTASIPSRGSPAATDRERTEAVLVSQTPFAIDIGGAASLEGIDILWRERMDAYGSVLDGLTPRILLQQTSGGSLELRLVAGPIHDAADAAVLCAQLVASGLQRCLPAIFDGQQLALR